MYHRKVCMEYIPLVRGRYIHVTQYNVPGLLWELISLWEPLVPIVNLFFHNLPHIFTMGTKRLPPGRELFSICI